MIRRSNVAFTPEELQGAESLSWMFMLSVTNVHDLLKDIRRSVKKAPDLGVLDRLEMTYDIVVIAVNDRAEARRFIGPEYVPNHMKRFGAWALTRFVVLELGIECKLAYACASLLRMALVEKIEPGDLITWIGEMRNFEKKAIAYHQKVWATT